MKKFIFCESEEGGLKVFFFTEGDMLLEKSLRGWMSKGCTTEDQLLLHFIATSEVGDYHEHRLGYCFRVKDI